MTVTGTLAPRMKEARDRLSAVGQEHVLAFADGLTHDGLERLLAQVDALDLEALPGLIETYVHARPSLGVDAGSLAPAPVYPNDPSDPRRPWDRAAYKAAGEALIRAGKVAAFTVAGGQGSRLGYDGPKGEYPGGAVTGKPLFRMLAESIVATERRYACAVPWYVMTSPQNHERTVAFFREHAFFGHREADVMFFPQGVMPSLEMGTGRLLLAGEGEIATNPDGHGGSLRALRASGALADMKSRGVEHISYFQVDNPLVRAIDPVFLGLHATAPDSSGEMCAKVVLKTEPAEKVGVICDTPSGTSVIEYSDLPTRLAEEREADGALRFSAGSIAIHIIGVGFVERLTAGGAFALPFHRAEKKVPCIDPDSGKRTAPETPNAVKLETFVFDALPLAERPLVYETDRVEEFAPIKNAEGADSPATCSRLQTERAARWLASVGREAPRDASGEPACVLELSPLTALEPEDLRDADLPAIEPGARVAL